MQASDANKIATPEVWTPGGDVIVPPPKTSDAVAKRASEGYKTVDWYYSSNHSEPQAGRARALPSYDARS